MSEETVRRKQRRRSGVAVLFALLVIGGLLGAGYVGVTRVAGAFRGSAPVEDFAGPGGSEVVFQVRQGETAEDVARRLEQEGVVKSSRSFVEAARADEERANDLQPGFYRLRREISGLAAFTALVEGQARAETRVTVPEGLRLEETVTTLSKGTGIPEAQFTRALRGDIGLPSYARGKAEGFLFPATYEVPPGASAADVLKLMTARFGEAARKVGLEGHPEHTPYEIVTIASLLEAEADGPGDFGKVARVIYNRLDKGMKLQFDSTVNYANGESKKVVYEKDLDRAANSPYSTYENAGLPPGPIGSPGEQALAAAKDPQPGDWVYFITTNIETGETRFTASNREFVNLKNACKAAATC